MAKESRLDRGGGASPPLVVRLDGVPGPASDVSGALVLASEYRLVLAYRVPIDTGSPAADTPGSPAGEERDTYAVFRLSAEVHRFGYPNDEALDGHPLFALGLEFYAAAEVINSKWPSELERQNRVHPGHSPDYFASLRHLVFTFHDSTFECLCRRFDWSTFEGSDDELLAHLSSLLKAA